MIKRNLKFSMLINNETISIITGPKKVLEYLRPEDNDLSSMEIGISEEGEIQEIKLKGYLTEFLKVSTKSECTLCCSYSADVDMGMIYLPIERDYDYSSEFYHEKLRNSLYVDVNKDGTLSDIEINSPSSLFPEIVERLEKKNLSPYR